MTQIALIAEFELHPNGMESFLAAAEQELEAVRENEPGCVRFDVILYDGKEGTGAFVEVFADEEAADKHRDYPHFNEFFDAIKDIDVKWTARRDRSQLITVAPTLRHADNPCYVLFPCAASPTRTPYVSSSVFQRGRSSSILSQGT